MALVSATDAMFLMAETRSQPMHVGGLQVFELPEDAGPDWTADLFERLISVDELDPLFTRRAVRSPRNLGAWSWERDQDVDITYHVRRSALPSPARVRELLEVTSRWHSGLLDRHRPLWEFHLVEGLEGHRFAAYSKVHHSLMDGVTAMAVLSRGLSEDPDELTPAPWIRRPRRRPRASGSPLQRVTAPAKALGEIGGMGPAVARMAVGLLREQAMQLPFAAPRTILNVDITSARRFAADSWSLEKLRTVAKSTGTTLNDVCMAMCSGALRRYLLEMSALPDAPLIAMAPVSLKLRHTEDDDDNTSDGGNAVGAVLCNLGTDLDDPLDRLEAIHTSMLAAKESLKGLSQSQVLALSAGLLSPTSLAYIPGVRRVASPTFNLVISNVPGPREPRYMAGAHMQGSYPVSIPLAGQALNITITSYADTMAFGLTGCRRSVPHLQRMLTHLDTSLEELLAETV